VNTCSVREHAEDKVWSLLGTYRPLKVARPSLRIGVLGCMAQRVKGEIARRAPFVDLVLGTSSFRHVVEDLDDLERRGGRILRTDRRPAPEHLPDADREISVREHHHRAFVTVMRGCDHVCTYCIVPFTRGREVSRPMADVLREVERLVADGVREIVSGRTSPTARTAGRGGLPPRASPAWPDRLLPDEQPLRHDRGDGRRRRPGHAVGIRPVRLGTVLRRMKRTYTGDQYREVVGWARTHIRDVEITSDFIVGFPGETDAEFDATLRLLQDVRPVQAYVFKYSVRFKHRAPRRRRRA
jgi:tRNA-2-methylthio-N6-dimethylallyladenosine synthase